jgi:hypothetical protein
MASDIEQEMNRITALNLAIVQLTGRYEIVSFANTKTRVVRLNA